MSKYVRLAVSVLILGWFAWTTPWGQVGDAFERLHAGYWLAAVALLVAAQLASALRWQMFAHELRFPCSTRRLFGIYLIGMYFNLFLPTSVGGDVVRAMYLDQGSGRRLAAFAAVFLERLNGLLVLIALACCGVAFSPMPLPTWISLSVWGIAASAVLGLVGLVLLQRWQRLPAQRQRQLQTMVQALHSPQALVWATLLSIFVQVANVGIVWLSGLALEAAIPFSYYWIFVPMVSLLTLLPVSVNGMGVREGATTLFLAHLGTVDQATALTLAFLWFAVYGAVSLLGGVVYLFGSFPKPGTQAGASSEGNDNGSVGRGSDQGREGQLEQAA